MSDDCATLLFHIGMDVVCFVLMVWGFRRVRGLKLDMALLATIGAFLGLIVLSGIVGGWWGLMLIGVLVLIWS